MVTKISHIDLRLYFFKKLTGNSLKKIYELGIFSDLQITMSYKIIQIFELTNKIIKMQFYDNIYWLIKNKVVRYFIFFNC